MNFFSIKRLFGGMNKDSELLDVQNGDSLDSLNVRTITAEGHTSGSAESVLGNEFVFDIGSVIQQNKIWRISFSTDAVTTYTVRFLDQNKKAITPVLSFSTAAFINNITGFLAFVTAGINTALSTAGQTSVITSTVTEPLRQGYLTIELTTILGRDWFVQSQDIFEVQEAIDLSLTGPNHIIGSVDLLGDLFILSTPITKDISTVNISNVTNATPITVTTSTAHGILTGENILIKSVAGTTSANGYWIVNVINATQFTLLGSVSSAAYTGGGVVTKNSIGFGELGVAQKDIATDTWTYISLGSTKRFNFRTTHQAEMRAEIDGIRKSIYWTDDNDYYRVAYYYGAYVTNGLFTAFNSQGIYSFDTLDNETKLFLASPSPLISITQESGGTLKCGNWRYAVRGIVEGFIGSEWSYLSNPIEVYPTPTSSSLDAQYVVGGTPDQISNKTNVIQVDNFPIGLYNFIELAAIQYVGNLPIGAIAIRQAISQQASSVTIRHTGSTTGQVDLDLASLSQVFASIVKGKNLVLLDNRLVVSNFTVQRDYDLSVWATQIQYRIQRQILQSIEFVGSTNGLKLEEYLKPTNVTNFMGYMINETYRFGVRLKWKKSSWSVPYFIADITISTAGASGQRLGGLPDNSLTVPNGTQIYVPYVEFTNLNLNFQLSDGSFLVDHLDDDFTANIQFLRAEMDGTTWEVLCTGVLAGAEAVSVIPNSGFITNPPTPFAGSTTKGFLYSPDVYFKSAFPSNTGGLVMKFLDTPTFNSGYTSGTHMLTEYNGDFTGSSFSNQAIVASQIMDLSASDFGNNIFYLETGVLTPPLANGATDVGLNYIQLFRAKANKFGVPETTRYITTGNPFSALGVTTASTFAVFGGDTFTQKTFKVIKQVSASEGYGVSFFSQNRVNAQMQLNKDSAGSDIFTVPGVGGTSVSGLNDFLGANSNNLNTNAYNTGYDIQNLLQFFIGFDPSLPQQDYFPVRIAYSEEKLINGISDAYRIILPLNFRDLIPSYGPINHMDVWNGLLITWQTRKFMRQYFKSNGQLSSNVGEILVGDGSILSRDGEDLTQYGTSHKWSVSKGISPGGKDVFYWICAEFKKVMRFGLDGTNVLSDEKFMQSFFAKNLQYVLRYFTPADRYGITATYNPRFAEAIITVRCINPNATLAVIGDSIVAGNYRYYTLTSFDNVPIIYKATSSFSVTNANLPGVGANWEPYWERIDLTDTQAYNLYTIVCNAYIKRITVFFTFKPKIYLKYRDGYLSPHPTSANKVYEHDRGEYMEWYKEILSGAGTISYTDGSTSITGTATAFIALFPEIEGIVYYLIIAGTEYEVLSVQGNLALTLKTAVNVTGTTSLSYARANSEDGYVQSVINDAPNDIKGFRAIRLNCDIIPDRVEFNTQTLQSYLEAGDFEEVQSTIQAAIKNDSTVSVDNPTGVNDGDTSQLWGKYLKVKIFFTKRKYQKIYDFLIKFAAKARLSNK